MPFLRPEASFASASQAFSFEVSLYPVFSAMVHYFEFPELDICSLRTVDQSLTLEMAKRLRFYFYSDEGAELQVSQ